VCSLKMVQTSKGTYTIAHTKMRRTRTRQTQRKPWCSSISSKGRDFPLHEKAAEVGMIVLKYLA